MTIAIERLTPLLGAAVAGVDLSAPLADDLFADLHRAWLDHDGLLVVHGQHLAPEAQIAFSRRIGPVFGEAEPYPASAHKYLLPGQPAIYRVSNKVRDGVPQGRARAGAYWHSDMSFRARPARASLLHAIELPSHGGDTLFADMHQAYDALSGAMKDLLDGLQAVHDFQHSVAVTGTWTAEQIVTTDYDGENRAVHPVVARHPETGRKALYVNPGFTSGLVGFAPDESRALLDFLFRHATRPEFTYRHRWAPGDLVVWDNRSLMHYAVVDYQGLGDRHMHRTTVIGEPPA